MSEEQNTPIVEQNNVKNDDTKVEKKENMVPQSRVNELTAQKHKLEEQLQAELKKRETERANELAKQGEYKTMYDELDTKYEKLTETSKQWEADSIAFKEYKEQKRASLMDMITNDEDKKIASELSLSMLEKFADRVTQTNAVSTPNQRPAGAKDPEFGGYSSMTEFAQKDPKRCDEFLKKSVAGYQWGRKTN